MSTKTGLMPPQPSFQESIALISWQNFQRDIWDKGKALDFLINTLEIIRDNKSLPFEFYFEKYEDVDIKRSEIHSHYYNLLCGQEDKSDRNIWNIQNNILRVLKTVKSNEPIYLLSRKDRALTYKFIDMLDHPPHYF